MASLAELNNFKNLLQEEKEKVEFHNESCKRYLAAYEKAKREVERLLVENDRLKVRISEIKEISMAKEANYEMISHLGSLDQEFYQGTIEKLRQENVVLKEENKLLKELTEVGSANEKMNFLNNVKARQEQILLENTQISMKNESLKKDLDKKSKEFIDLNDKYQQLLEKQLDQSRLFVIKDEEIRFWKCALIELLCGEVLNNYTKEFEFSSIFDSPVDLSEKYLRIKEKLQRMLKQKTPILISNDSEEMITERSFILTATSPAVLISSLADAVLTTNDKIQLVLTSESDKKSEITARSSSELMKKLNDFSKSCKEVLVHVCGQLDVWIYDLHSSPRSTKEIIECVFSSLDKSPAVRNGLRTAESIYILTE